MLVKHTWKAWWLLTFTSFCRVHANMTTQPRSVQAAIVHVSTVVEAQANGSSMSAGRVSTQHSSICSLSVAVATSSSRPAPQQLAWSNPHANRNGEEKLIITGLNTVRVSHSLRVLTLYICRPACDWSDQVHTQTPLLPATCP